MSDQVDPTSAIHVPTPNVLRFPEDVGWHFLTRIIHTAPTKEASRRV
jgi:hypothetical protein